MAKTSTAKTIILGFASLMLMKVSRNVTNNTFQSDKLQMTESSVSSSFLWEHQCMVTTAFLKTETSDHVFYKLLQEIFAFVSLPNIILSKLESPPLLITPQRQRRFVVAAGYECFD